jgi:glycosyltransferase involved in cell wall biosynthesis
MEEYEIALSRELRRRGDKHMIVFAEPIADAVRSKLEEQGATVEGVDTTKSSEFHARLRQLLSRYRPDVIHLHFCNVYSWLPILARLSRPKMIVATDHIRLPIRASKTKMVKLWLWDRIVLAFCGLRLYAVSNHIRRLAVRQYLMAEKRAGVLYNGINLDRFVPLSEAEQLDLRRELKLGKEQPVVVCAAYLIPEKGINHLLDAAAIVLDRRADTAFIIIGDGPESVRLKEQARQLRIDSNILFTGLRSDVHRFMGLADIVAVPSVWQEPAALVLMEGMASCAPVVATRVGGTPELIANGVTGKIVEPGSAEQLASALLFYLNSPAERKKAGDAGRARVEKMFSMQRWVRDTLAIYDGGEPSLQPQVVAPAP